ncbi:ABC transporter substrate-binding protein [Pseudoroseicyclus tamaricis]|uniref:ABC transporter substrate-binding protein n=1 Tax=Pseudoroseicyclus tamaricis TaxID=2705421 RepID=A0A6B2JNH3_9RHOB|nr:ABC transporter substrate-binding protein [Pseudoroseicyclus tamaricis]NDV00237.1 ABC transporter substrate-binding protein [Pseudoroseicyclus tamaricis]
MKTWNKVASAGAGLLLGTALAGPALAQTVITLDTPEVPGSLDPSKISDAGDYALAVNLYDALMTVLPGGALAPELAESWEVNEDATEATFFIREDATFTDGSPVEASDVVYSYDRLMRLNQGPSNLFAGVVESVEAVDAKTVRFTLSKTFAPFLATVPSIFIINEEVATANDAGDDAQEWLATNPAGAGAYLLKDGPSGSGIVIERDEDYYGGWNESPIDEVRWIVAPDDSTVRSLAASGELTMVSAFRAPETYDALMEMGRFTQEDTSTATAYLLKLNTQLAPTDDVHIRRAIAYATDYDTIREVIYPGEELTGPLPPAFADFIPEGLPAPEFDMEKAAEEVAQSSYAGAPIPITLGYVAGTQFEEEISLLLQSNLEQLGFEVTQQADPWARVVEIAGAVETTPNVNQVFFGPTYPSPDSMFFSQYHSDSAGSWTSMEWLEDPEIDALIDEARSSGDPEVQAAAYGELQERIVDMQADVFLLTLTFQLVMDECLTGYEFVPMQSVPSDFTRYEWLCD